MTRTIGVCSWSLRPRDPRELAERARECGVSAVQLALDPLRTGAWDVDGTVAALGDAGLTVRSGMMATRGEDYGSLEAIARTGGVRLEEHWDENLAAARANGALAARLGLDLISFHAGFLPEEPGDPVRATMIERLRAVIDAFAEHGVRTAFETGQESAATLAAVLDELDRPTLGVNFDPANMILYGMGEPLEALATLAPRVLQIHVKDAVRAATPGTWGEEVPAGEGQVDWGAFFELVRDRGLDVDLMIEREAGEDRMGDIRRARALVERHVAGGAA